MIRATCTTIVHGRANNGIVRKDLNTVVVRHEACQINRNQANSHQHFCIDSAIFQYISRTSFSAYWTSTMSNLSNRNGFVLLTYTQNLNIKVHDNTDCCKMWKNRLCDVHSVTIKYRPRAVTDEKSRWSIGGKFQEIALCKCKFSRLT